MNKMVKCECCEREGIREDCIIRTKNVCQTCFKILHMDNELRTKKGVEVDNSLEILFPTMNWIERKIDPEDLVRKKLWIVLTCKECPVPMSKINPDEHKSIVAKEKVKDE